MEMERERERERLGKPKRVLFNQVKRLDNGLATFETKSLNILSWGVRVLNLSIFGNTDFVKLQ
jgi:hypothetical protein